MRATKPVTLQGVFLLAVPVMGSGVLQALFRPVDQYFVQGLGSAAQGALGATTLVGVLAMAPMLVFSAGVTAYVGRHTGAARDDARRTVVEQTLGAAFLLGVGLAVLGGLSASTLTGLLGLEGEGARLATVYLQVLFGTGVALAVSPTVDATFHAMGDTRTPLVLQVGTVGLNILLTALLVPRLGVAGAALGSTIAQTLGTGVGVAVLTHHLGLDLRRMRPGSSTGGVIEVGLPMGLMSGMFGLVYWVMMGTTFKALGQDVYAGLGLGFGVLESVSWPAYMGLSIAASSLVGRSLGAGRPDEAWKAVRYCMVPAATVGMGMGAVYWFGGPAIMGAFATDPAAYREGLRYATLLAVVQPLVAMEAVSEGVLSGSGDTRKLFWTNVPLVLLRIPLSWLLAITLGLGANGLWMAINISTLLKWTAKLALVFEGSWLHRSLRD